MKKNLGIYILIGILAAAAFMAGFAAFDVLLGNKPTFVEGLKSVWHIVCGIVFGISVAGSIWKKNNKEEKK